MKVPEIADVPVSQPDDIWQLGPHRLACGDSREWARLSADLAKLNLMIHLDRGALAT
jgi:hypothetical protein